MSGTYGVIAEGWIQGHWVTSLGKAGVDGEGRLRPNACTSKEGALYRALRSCANKFRARKDGVDDWVEFPQLPEATQRMFILEVSKSVELAMVEPGLYRTEVSDAIFERSIEGVLD